ncbi:uncharacterized protein LOC130828108 [Amaranthus tricolor]|uniref:uncharacterized protein LOC130828108 n=1 Tax=Amaranthus tricolor TaxID=29722 RepID=UPI00258259F3|nr:uncharacterized protein LOC130828108 [Amaranthus tricolor]
MDVVRVESLVWAKSNSFMELFLQALISYWMAVVRLGDFKNLRMSNVLTNLPFKDASHRANKDHEEDANEETALILGL